MRYFGYGIGHVQDSVRASPGWGTEIRKIEEQLGLTVNNDVELTQNPQDNGAEVEIDDIEETDEEDDPVVVDEDPLAELW